ncbi:MAG: hypothetical protein GY788_11065 [bacterium]|nr:hypothetical protein [bacterium]
MSSVPLQPMPEDWEPTRATLHNYANALGVIARAHAKPHDRWWHISLKVSPTGFVTDPLPLLDGGTLDLRMDFGSHEAVLETSTGKRRTLSMADGPTGTEFGSRLIAMVGELGLTGEYVIEKFESDDARAYEASDAETFLAAMVAVNHNLEIHRRSLQGPVGPLQIWPHGFDLAFEWYGTKMAAHEEGGESTEMPAQLNLGFYPAGRPYFYSNPWPFDAAALTKRGLPAPAQWNTQGWEGSILYYDELLATPNPAQKLLEYAQAVFDAAAPTLTA